MIGIIAIGCSALSLGMVIDALITTRILIQFIGQIVALTLLRKNAPDMPRPFRVWLYPIPNVDRAVRMDLPVRHFRSDRHRVRAGHAAARYRHLLHLELAHAALAIRRHRKSIGVQSGVTS